MKLSHLDIRNKKGVSIMNPGGGDSLPRPRYRPLTQKDQPRRPKRNGMKGKKSSRP